MPKPFDRWTVLPHDKIVRVDDNLLCVNGKIEMPLGTFERRMTVVRLASGRLAIFSAIALDEAEMALLEAFGQPSHLIVPNELHRMDVKIWKDRYPNIVVVAPVGARAKVEEIVAVDQTTVDFGDAHVQFGLVPGTGEKEGVLLVSSPGGTTLVLADLIFNVRNRPGFTGWISKTFGMTADDPHMPGLIRMREVDDQDALRLQLERWAHLPNLTRIIVSHGKIIERDAGAVLEKVARELAA